VGDSVDKVLSGEQRWCVVNADCRDILRALPDKSIDHVVADPPYSSHTHKGMVGTIGSGDLGDGKEVVARDCGFDPLSPSLRHAISFNACRVAKGWIALFSDWESTWLWRLSIEASGGSYRRSIPWIRWSSPQFSGHAPPTGSEAILMSKPVSRGRKWLNSSRVYYNTTCLRAVNKIGAHPTEKPEALMVEVLSDFAVANDIVLDMTCGSGTTLVAALRLGMRAVGIEKDQHWAQIAHERCEAETLGMTLAAARQGQQNLFGGQP